MKAQHNTFTYLPIMQWWLRPFDCLFRCQDRLVVSEYLDIRVRFHEGKVYVCHGWARYFFLNKKNIVRLCDRYPKHARVICEQRITENQYTRLRTVLKPIFNSYDLITKQGVGKLRYNKYSAANKPLIHNYWQWSWAQPIPIPKLWRYSPIAEPIDVVILEDFMQANK